MIFFGCRQQVLYIGMSTQCSFSYIQDKWLYLCGCFGSRLVVFVKPMQLFGEIKVYLCYIGVLVFVVL